MGKININSSNPSPEEPLIKAFNNDLEKLKAYVAGELIKLGVTKKGKINLDDPDFKILYNAFLTLDPAMATKPGDNKSLIKIEHDITQFVDKKIKDNGPDNPQNKVLEKFKNETMRKFREDITKDLGSDEGVRKLVNDKIIYDDLKKAVPFKGELGGYEVQDKDIINDAVKTEIMKKIQQNLKLPPEFESFITKEGRVTPN